MNCGALAAPAYPLKLSGSLRCLVDQNDVPFLMVGDSPQAAVVQLNLTEADAFFANRAASGFNTVWINLLCNDYTGGRADGSTKDGIRPFLSKLGNTSTYDLASPNPVYFAKVDTILNLAAKYGLLVVLDPIETGGWQVVMDINDVDRCRAYGQYLGNRYKNFDNIVWMNGNDFQGWEDPGNDAVVQAVALGIKDRDTRHLQTVELNYFVSSSLDDPSWTGIIDFNCTYTYYATYARLLQDYSRGGTMPSIMVEANYEFERNYQDKETLRRQEWWTMLSGACGQFYGNHYTWQFIPGWKQHLNTAGCIQLRYMKAFFEGRPWYDLVPDQDHSIMTAGYGTFTDAGSVNTDDYATTASTSDGAYVLSYIPSSRTVTIDLSALSGSVRARWFDPASAVYSDIPGSPFGNSGMMDFTTPGLNSDRDEDWVLVLESVSTPDLVSPTLTVKKPKAHVSYVSTVRRRFWGTAMDDQAVERVEYRVAGSRRFRLANGRGNWFFDAALNPGPNKVWIRAVDAAGNITTSTRVVVRP